MGPGGAAVRAQRGELGPPQQVAPAPQRLIPGAAPVRRGVPVPRAQVHLQGPPPCFQADRQSHAHLSDWLCS